MRFRIFLMCFLAWGLTFSPTFAQDWVDGTHLFDEETRWLADNVKKESIADFQMRTTGVVQYADTKPPAVGDERVFNAFNIEKKRFEQVRSVMKKIGKHCYVFLQKGKNVSPAAIDRIVQEFDSKIYPTVTRYFGSEWSPGIDGDRRITIFMLDIQDGYSSQNKNFTAGYFYSGDEYLRSSNPNSNQREMLYLDIYPSDPTKKSYMSVVAHEFQHMIHWHADPKEYSWLNESMSQLAPFLCGYGHPPQLVAFLRSPDNSLCAWSGRDMIPNYGQVYLFAYYLMDHFSSNREKLHSLLSAIVRSTAKGMDSVKAALKKNGYSAHANNAFKMFCAANYINDTSFASGYYGYDAKMRTLRLAPMKKHGGQPFVGKGTVKCWSAQAIEMNIAGFSGPIRFRFNGQTKLAQRRYRNKFDVAALFSGGRVKPIVEWFSSSAQNNTIDKMLKTPAGGHSKLMLVVCNYGPTGSVETPYAASAGSTEFAYAISMSKGTSRSVSRSGTARNTRHRISRSEIQQLVQEIRQSSDLLKDIPPEFSEEADIQSSIFSKELNRIDQDEDKIVQAVQEEIENRESDLIKFLFETYQAEDQEGKRKLSGLFRKINDLLRFEVMQNDRQDLAEFLPK